MASHWPTHVSMESQRQMVTPLLRSIKKVLFFAVPVGALAGVVIASHCGQQASYGLLVGGIGPLTLALALDQYLNRDTENR